MRLMDGKKYFKETRVRAKLDSYLAEAKQEYKSYLKTKDTTKLAEAGEKLWGASNYLMELKANKSLKTAKEVGDAVYGYKDTTLITVYDKVYILHQFFYGWVDRIEEIERAFNSAEKGIEIYRSDLKDREKLYA